MSFLLLTFNNLLTTKVQKNIVLQGADLKLNQHGRLIGIQPLYRRFKKEALVYVA
jgi:hypothetical protein